MCNSIYRYQVSYNFCGHRNEKQYKDLQNAAKNALAALDEYKNFSDVENSIRINQIEYASKRNLEKGFSLQVRPIWANGFHHIEDLKILTRL